jgi:hypothetical protein
MLGYKIVDGFDYLKADDSVDLRILTFKHQDLFIIARIDSDNDFKLIEYYYKRFNKEFELSDLNPYNQEFICSILIPEDVNFLELDNCGADYIIKDMQENPVIEKLCLDLEDQTPMWCS